MLSMRSRMTPLWCAFIVFLTGGLVVPIRSGLSSPRDADPDPVTDSREVHGPHTTPEWTSQITDEIRLSEYRFSHNEDGLWSAPNRAHGLRTHLDATGLRVTSRTQGSNAQEGGWELRILLSSVGYEGSLSAVTAATPHAVGERIEIASGTVSEWYVNNERGLEQGFTLASPPRKGSAGAPLILDMILGGSLSGFVSEDGQLITFRTANGEDVLHYGGLKVKDSRGTPLDASLVLLPGRLQIRINDEGAVYPLTVDPIMTLPSWTAESNQASAEFGISVSTAGDVNGDGFSDVIIGADRFDNGQTDEGAAFVYLGSSVGLGLTPARIIESNQAFAFFGYSVGAAGDVNGDGFSDVIIGATDFDNGQDSEGRAFVYHGSASVLDMTLNWTAEGNQSFAFFGSAVATAGDVNGDGFDDVIIAAPGYDNVQSNEGRAFVYHGSSGGLPASPAWTTETNQNNAGVFDLAVATAGDVNGDGFSDVIVGAPQYDNGQPDEGRAYVYHGSSSGLASTPAWTKEINQNSAWFGRSVATAGDVNGDGFSDVIVGAPLFDNVEVNEGSAFVYLGSSSGLGSSPSWTGESINQGSNVGYSVASAGDVNGDGFGDVLVGAFLSDNGETDEGRAFMYLGSSSGLANSPIWTEESDQTNGLFGISVGTAGDVNGDGFSDIVVGASGVDNIETDEGVAYVYHGSASGLASANPWTAESDVNGSQFGYSVAPAQDVNGDGYSDVIVGAYAFDNGLGVVGRVFVYHGSSAGLSLSPSWTEDGTQVGALFGYSVSTAGDVNKDGYSDVIIGSVQFSNGQNLEGRADVYHGSSMGLDPSPAWGVEGEKPNAGFGNSVATAGDVNGDGFSDVIVGAPGYTNGQAQEGRVYVYHGSSSGLSSTPSIRESDWNNAYFGWSVATAGDVNADGFSDIIVGAYRYSNVETDEGRAYVYHGGAGGIASSPAWTQESNKSAARFGSSVATAGDVDGNGYSDIIVGAPLYNSTGTAQGRVFVYQGSSSGLSTGPIITGDQSLAQFGIAVSTAGDVNGDGYSDVIVGAHLYDNTEDAEGRAYVYHGSSSGLLLSPGWTGESNEPSAQFGISVATAGDVNGDGFSDIIVGANLFDNNQTAEGRAFVFYGNGSPGLSRIPNQARSNDTALIVHLGKSDAANSFRLRADGRTPAGRGKVRLQWEIKALGTAFNGTGLGQGSFVDTGTPVPGSGSAVSLNELVSGLTAGTVYKWRLRTVSGNAFFPRSPWFVLPYNNRTESDLRTP